MRRRRECGICTHSGVFSMCGICTTPNLKKLDDRSRPMIFIGYEPGSKAYSVYNPLTKKVHVSRDVIFDE
jgi:hypothetical protein